MNNFPFIKKAYDIYAFRPDGDFITAKTFEMFKSLAPLVKLQ